MELEDLDDLDSFIANIEQTAPEEDLDEKLHRCQECDAVLEDVDGTFICPNCSAQATNILQLEETELHYDEQGRVVRGQMVKTVERKIRQIDYGWAWSTDEAIVHILCQQLKALEKMNLISRNFIEGTKNMWTKFWVENVAPHIKDEYREEDLVQLKELKSLKMRDIEVLVKVQNKVMIPKRLVKTAEERRKSYIMYGTKFTRSDGKEEEQVEDEEEQAPDFDLSDDEVPDLTNRSLHCTPTDTDHEMVDEKLNDQDITAIADQIANEQLGLTRTLARSNVAILTLNRTLAFIEATARCMKLAKPIFASDLIRACNQRSIPFFGAHKVLPEGINLNHKDKALFQKTRPPSPIQLTRTAMMLVHRIYRDKLPLLLPVPDLITILKRFIEDMNLPLTLLDTIEGQISFENFKRTRPVVLRDNKQRLANPPQYDRWAFAILVCKLKRYFNFDDPSIHKQAEKANKESTEKGENCFVFQDWIKQISMRLQLIMSYDPFIMFHPMTDLRMLQPHPQMYKYIECILSDRVIATTRSTRVHISKDENHRNELSDFLKRELPIPENLHVPENTDEDLDKLVDVWHPILDSMNRTKRFWFASISKNKELHDLLFRDFKNDGLITLKTIGLWSIWGDNCHNKVRCRPDIQPEWPYCFKLLLSVGAYLCYCQPRDLLIEVKSVDEFLYPSEKVSRKKARYSIN